MITVQQIADHINQTKPYAELKQMWTEVNIDNVDECINSLLDEPFTMLNAFKLELLVSYGTTHTRSYINDDTITKYKTYLKRHKVDFEFSFRRGYGTNAPAYISTYDFKAPIILDKFISAYVQDYTKYLNIYLKGQYRTSPCSTTEIKLNLEDNEFSLLMFKDWLTKHKSLNSVQALGFLNTCMKFTTYKSQFIEAILDHCPKPSLELQSYLEETPTLLNGTKYSAISRSTARQRSQPGLSTPYIFDYRDSDYKPFVANLTKTPVLNLGQIESWISNLAVTWESEPDYAKALLEHLKQPEYQSHLIEIIPRLKKSAETYLEIFKEF